MLEELKKQVYEANMELPKRGLITYTWGNVSGIDRETGYFVIKPSGVDYDALSPEDMVVMDLEGNKIEGRYKPSSDTATHLELYKKYPQIGGVVHTHSPEAVAWAQAGRDIPLYGTTHADYFLGSIPCARNLTTEEINEAYEKNTGLVIIETFEERKINPMYTPAVLCQNHGPFTWGKDAAEAVHNAVVLEEVAKMARNTEAINPNVKPAPDNIKQKHFYRKHGENAYNYECQLCSKEQRMPIKKNDGTQYVEVHHIKNLSEEYDEEGTLDRVNNLIVVCPNHHKMLHYHRGGYRKIKLVKGIMSFVNESDEVIPIITNKHLQCDE